jgi:protein-disulfide isomerase
MIELKPTRRGLLISGAGIALLQGLSPALAQTAGSPVADVFLGSADATVTLVEYGSYTCPHCAEFYATVYPKLKSEYIDTGKVKFVFRDFYRNKVDVWAGLLARCEGDMRFFGIADLLFEKQEAWAFHETALEVVDALKAIGRQTGLNDAQMDACMQDQARAEGLVEWAQVNAEADKVEGTPTFTINGTKYTNMPWEDFQAALNEALGV